LAKHAPAYFAISMETENKPFWGTLTGFESLFKEHYTPLFRYVKSIVKNEDQTKDVLSDLFLQLWQQKDHLQINDLKPYLFRCAKYGALKMIDPKQQSIPLSEAIYNIPSDTFNPFERFVAKQSVRLVKDLVDQLPPLRKEIINLRLLGLKYAEIAEVLEITEKKVEYNLREGIEQLSHSISHSNLDKATIAGGLTLVAFIFMSI